MGIDNTFDIQEKLYRAVRPWEDFWDVEYKKISSAALKDINGLSVIRGYHRCNEDVIEQMRKKQLQGAVVSFCVKKCYDVKAVVRYMPSRNDVYHSEIHGNEYVKILDDNQAEYISKFALVVDKKL